MLNRKVLHDNGIAPDLSPFELYERRIVMVIALK